MLLEDEKIVVSLRAASTYLCRSRNMGAVLSTGLHHPRVGAGPRQRTLTVSLSSTCGDVMATINGKIEIFF